MRVLPDDFAGNWINLYQPSVEANSGRIAALSTVIVNENIPIVQHLGMVWSDELTFARTPGPHYFFAFPINNINYVRIALAREDVPFGKTFVCFF